MKRVLLWGVAGLFAATSAMAQTDVTPKNWKFDGMQKGSAASLFNREASALGSNYISQVLDNGRKGFRYADNWEGGFSVAHWTGGGDFGYAAMPDEAKEVLENFYKAFQVVDGGALGNVLIYQGNSSTETDNRAVRNESSMVFPNVYAFTQKDLDPGIYKISIPIRVILNPEEETVTVSVEVGTSWWDGIPLAGSGGSGYGKFDLSFVPFFNQAWTLYEFEIEVKPNKDATYDFAPVMTKLGINGIVANKSIIILDDLKLERMPDVTLDGRAKITPLDWNDAPTGIYSANGDDNVIVFANNNGIQVIDATTAIEVYDAAGQLIDKVLPKATVTTIPVSDKGVYIVKTGKTTRKVVY